MTGLRNTEMEQELRGINGEMTDEEDEAKKKIIMMITVKLDLAGFN